MKDNLIYDVGMHKGQDTLFYLRKGFKVVAIEANPILCREAREKFAEYLATGQLTILELGIAEKEAELIFYINPQSEWSSFDQRIGTRGCDNCQTVIVKCRRLSDVIKEYGEPYYIKIDIEGYDNLALESLKNDGITAKFISVENGNLMLNLLVDMGYDRFKYIQQNNMTSIKPPFPAREGKYIPYSFEFGASGPFGEETDGEWKTADDVSKEICKVWDLVTGEKNPNHDDNIHGWFDLHARHKNYQKTVIIPEHEAEPGKGWVGKIFSFFRRAQ